jgi:hypothetical protein
MEPNVTRSRGLTLALRLFREEALAGIFGPIRIYLHSMIRRPPRKAYGLCHKISRTEFNRELGKRIPDIDCA